MAKQTKKKGFETPSDASNKPHVGPPEEENHNKDYEFLKRKVLTGEIRIETERSGKT